MIAILILGIVVVVTAPAYSVLQLVGLVLLITGLALLADDWL